MKKGLVPALVAVAVAIPLGLYAAGPLFINNTINEAPPVNTPVDNNADEQIDGMAGEQGPEASADLAGNFTGVGDEFHDASGIAKVIAVGDAKVLRLETFSSTNGPDLYVYLSTDKEATDFVSLGRLKANIGNQNYDIPEGTDLSKYSTVLVWCQQFSVLFGNAELAST
jgi:electron transfer DM13